MTKEMEEALKLQEKSTLEEESKAPEQYGQLLLPSIKVKNTSVSKNVGRRVAFLWSTAHQMLAVSPLIAHEMINQMINLLRENHMTVSKEVMDYICDYCSGLLVPGLSAKIKVQHQKHHAPINRKLARQRRQWRKRHPFETAPRAPETLRNALRVTCSRCEKVNTRPGASVIFKPKVSKKKRSLEEATGATPATNQEIALDNESIKRRKIKGAPSSDPQPNISSSCTGSTPSVSQSEVSIHEDSEVKVSTDSLKNQGELATNVPEFKSIFAPPPSPPRKLLDGPKKKKKKKTDSGTKSSLDSFLKSLRS